MFSLGPIPARPGEASKGWLGFRPRWHAVALGVSLGVAAFASWRVLDSPLKDADIQAGFVGWMVAGGVLGASGLAAVLLRGWGAVRLRPTVTLLAHGAVAVVAFLLISVLGHPATDRGPSLVGDPWGSLALCGVVALLGTAAGAGAVAIVGWLVIRPFVVVLRTMRREGGIPITVWCEELASLSLLPLGIGLGMGSTHVDGGHPITFRDGHQLLVFLGFPVAGMQAHPLALWVGRVAGVVLVGAIAVRARHRRMARADHASPG